MSKGSGTAFGILGPMEVTRQGRRIVVPAAKQRIALATLLLHPNQYVSADHLIEHMWHEGTPNDARAALHTHIARLRHVLGNRREGKQLIHTRHHGYLIQVGDDEVDVARFHDLVRRAEQATEQNAEAGLLRAALDLWRGPALADVPSESLHRDHAGRLDEERLQALERWLELALQAGRHEQIVAELQTATAAHPLRERLWTQLMLALYRCGRQAEALQAYHTIASLLREELGIDPGDDLRRLHQSILDAEPALMSPRSAPRVGAEPEHQQEGPAEVCPRQLPSDTAAFTGRLGELRTLDALLRPSDDQATRMPRIAVIVGTAGVGKTALAVHWGHRTSQWFSHGQLYVNLRGFGHERPIEPGTALEMMLQSLGVPAQRIPADLDARSALLRTMLADRRVLMLLDNARDVAQVRPLLPGSDCVVLVTSRDQLRGLSMHGDTSHLTLGVFSPQETAELLASTLGSHRTRAEPGAAAELGRLCAHLPLALRIAIANLTLGRFDSLAAYVAELREGNRLAELRIEGDEQSAVQGTLDLSYAALRPHDRAMFRLLGLVPGADFTAEAAAALSGSAVEHAGRQLARLATAHLIHEYAPGRYRFHDLLRLYAAERAEAEESPESRQTARRRLYDWYLRSIRAAVERSHPHWARLPLPTDRTGVTAAGFDDLTSATAWLAAEHRNLVAAVQQAALSGPRQATWLLTDAMRSYFWASGRTGDWLSCARTAVTVAREEGDVPGTAAATLALADAYAFQGQCDELSLYAEALSAADKSGWKEGQSSIRNNLAGYHMRHGQLAEAVRCLRDGIKLDEQDGRSAWLGVKHVNLGMAYAQLGHLHAAFHHLTQALPLHADRDGIIATNLGEVCHLLGRFDDALRHLDRALRLLEEAGNRTVEPHCLTALTDVHCALGRYERALDFGRRALACSQEMENRLAEAMARNALGRVHDRTGHHAEAMDHHLRAVELAADDHFYVKAVALTGLANAAAGLGRAEAESFADQALRLARERSFRVVEGLALSAHADIALAAGDRATAVRQARLALEIHCETGHRLGEARTLRTLGNAADEADAVAYQKRAMRLFEELGSREAEPGH